MSAPRINPALPMRQTAGRRGGRRQRWLHWTQHFIKRLPIALANRWPRWINLRIFASDQLHPMQIENLRQLAEALAPRGVPVKLYILPKPQSTLLNLTCCLRSRGCEMVTVAPALLNSGDRQGELAGKLDELFSKCLAHSPVE